MIFRFKAGSFLYWGRIECLGVYDRALRQWSGPVFTMHDAKRIARAKNWLHLKTEFQHLHWTTKLLWAWIAIGYIGLGVMIWLLWGRA